MTQYQDELEKLSFSEQEQAEMTRRILKQNKQKGTLRLSYRFIAVAAAVSLLAGAAGAVSLAGLSREFRTFFGITEEKQAEDLGALAVGKVFEDKNGSGASITVKEVVTDQEQLYILMEFAAPDSMVLPAPELLENDRGYWIYSGGSPAPNLPGFFKDETCAQRADVYSGYSSGSKALIDDDPSDNRIPLLYHVITDRGFSEQAQYCRIPHISSLWTAKDGEAVAVLDGMDITVTVPMRSSTQSYAFSGRCGVNLGGTTMAVVENLSISPISLSLDLIIPDSAAYDAAFAKQGPWPVYVLLRDGSRVAAQYPKEIHGRLDQYHDPEGALFFRADHAVLTLAHPVDVAEIVDIVFVGDNDPISEQADKPGKIVYFFFTPGNFYNSSYWNNVNRYWMSTKD